MDAAADSSTGSGSGSVCVERLLYERALQLGREGAVDELMGNALASCNSYTRAIQLLDLVSAEGAISEADRATLRSYMVRFGARLQELRKSVKPGAPRMTDPDAARMERLRDLTQFFDDAFSPDEDTRRTLIGDARRQTSTNKVLEEFVKDLKKKALISGAVTGLNRDGLLKQVREVFAKEAGPGYSHVDKRSNNMEELRARINALEATWSGMFEDEVVKRPGITTMKRPQLLTHLLELVHQMCFNKDLRLKQLAGSSRPSTDDGQIGQKKKEKKSLGGDEKKPEGGEPALFRPSDEGPSAGTDGPLMVLADGRNVESLADFWIAFIDADQGDAVFDMCRKRVLNASRKDLQELAKRLKISDPRHELYKISPVDHKGICLSEIKSYFGQDHDSGGVAKFMAKGITKDRISLYIQSAEAMFKQEALKGVPMPTPKVAKQHEKIIQVRYLVSLVLQACFGLET
eukprot:tig00000478_g1286.t1